MIIKPKIRGFICTTTHPLGCKQNVRDQIAFVKSKGQVKNGPKKVLVIGASSGYGLSSRIAAAFGSGAATIGVFFEKPGTEEKTGTAGWYNSAAFDEVTKEKGLYAKSINGDAFSNEARKKAIELIKQDLGEVDMVVYSLASPVRKMPDTGAMIRSVLKPIGQPYHSTAIDTKKDVIIESEIEPATEEEVAATITVMGGQDWELWMSALNEAGVLTKGILTIAYSYIGSDITWPIYWHGALGKAKKDLDRASGVINAQLANLDGSANVAVLKSVTTQASSAIPMMPLYLAIVSKVMREKGLHEGCIDQIYRMFSERLYNDNNPTELTDNMNRFRLDNWELREDVQKKCRDLWPKINDANLFAKTDYQLYKDEFLKLFGFGVEGVNYEVDVDPLVEFDVITL